MSLGVTIKDGGPPAHWYGTNDKTTRMGPFAVGGFWAHYKRWLDDTLTSKGFSAEPYRAYYPADPATGFPLRIGYAWSHRTRSMPDSSTTLSRGADARLSNSPT